MAKKSEKSKSNRKAAAKPTDVQTKKNLQFRVRSLKDLQVTKDKKREKDKEMEENAGSDCEVIEMGEGGIKGSIKRKSSVDTIERESVSEPKIVKTEAAASLKSATRPFVASQRRGRDPAASLSSVQVTLLSIVLSLVIRTNCRCWGWISSSVITARLFFSKLILSWSCWAKAYPLHLTA